MRGYEVHQMVRQMPAIQPTLQANRTGRTLLNKVSKALDDKNLRLAIQSAKIQSLRARVDKLQPRKKKAVKLDPNDRFARIGHIMATKKALQGNLKAQAQSPTLGFRDMCFEWSIFDVVGDS
jgi:4-hydroxybenzoate polyprenyltransferase